VSVRSAVPVGRVPQPPQAFHEGPALGVFVLEEFVQEAQVAVGFDGGAHDGGEKNGPGRPRR
jgi:hypothetical protein